MYKNLAKLKVSWFLLVGMTGFEPATSSPPVKRATMLRHIPLPHISKFFLNRLVASDGCLYYPIGFLIYNL